MSALVLHLFPGTGCLVPHPNADDLALAVLVEAAVFFMQSGAPAGQSWLLVSQCALQFSYLRGLYLRSILERPGLAAQSIRQSTEN